MRSVTRRLFTGIVVKKTGPPHQAPPTKRGLIKQPIDLLKPGLTCAVVAIGLLMARCQPEATPLPASLLSVPTETPTPAPFRPIRYGLLANTGGSFSDFDQLAASADVEVLDRDVQPGDLGERFDLVAGYGLRPGWILSPSPLRVALVVNSTRFPLDDPAIADAMRRSVNPQTVVSALRLDGAEPGALTSASPSQLKATLANAGWPDGFDVVLGHDAPGATWVTDQLEIPGLEVHSRPLAGEQLEAAFADQRVHLALVAWTDAADRAVWTDRAGDANVLDLYTIPISYWAAEGLTITFTPGGWPVGSR